MHIQYQDQERGSFISSRSSRSKDSKNRREPSQKKEQSSSAAEVLPHCVFIKVPVGKIKYRNQIDGDNIYHLKVIIIPNPKVMPVEKEQTENILIEEFVGHMDYSEKSQKTARYYLEENQWNMQGAVKEYRDDIDWEKMNKHNIKTRPIDGPAIEMKDIKAYYDQVHQKKKKQ